MMELKELDVRGEMPAVMEIIRGGFAQAPWNETWDDDAALREYIEGLGDVLWSSCAGIAALAFRIAASYALVSFFGNMVIAYAEALSWILLLALYAARAAHNKKLIERRGI